MKKVLLVLSCLLGLLLVVASSATAATEAEKQAAIDAGLEWLASNQEAAGSWYDADSRTAATGAALLSFLEEGYSAGTDVIINGNNYGDVVGEGLNYVFSQATTYAIGVEPTGNPDGDGDGLGVKFVLGGNNSRDTYVTGLVLPAIAATGTPGAVVTTGALSGMTYAEVVQDTVDYFAYGQADPGNVYRGGWRYYADYGQADNSTAQWPVIASLFAGDMGVSAPQFVRDELQYWIDYVQYRDGSGTGLDGSSGYDRPLMYNNAAKTGGLLVEMAFAGEDLGGTAYDLLHPDLLAALAYLDREWQGTPSGTWYGNFGHPYAMWSVYKGLETTIGLDDTTYITNYFYDPTTVTLDVGDTYTWWEDYCEWLVLNQGASGAWTGYSYWDGALSTAWNINILAATEIPNGNEPVPEPATMVLFGVGLLGLGMINRRRKKDQ